MKEGDRVKINNARVKPKTTGIIVAVYETGTHPWAVVRTETAPFHSLCFDLHELELNK